MSEQIKVFCEDSSHEGRRCQVGTFQLLGGMREDLEYAVDGMLWSLEGVGWTAAERRAHDDWNRTHRPFGPQERGLAALVKQEHLGALPSEIARGERILLGRATGTIDIDPDGRAHDPAKASGGFDSGWKGWHEKWVLVCKICGHNVQMRAKPMFPILDALAAAGQDEVTLTFLEKAKTR